MMLKQKTGAKGRSAGLRQLLGFWLLLAWCLGTLADEGLDNEFADFSLEELMQVVVSSSRYEQRADQAHANVMVVTAEQIERRGYRTLVDLLEDLPGFDFATYEDGGGEYPSHSAHRGIGGDPGNTRLLVLVDGVVQNHIAFNWSTGWGGEQMLHDLARVEVIQGPGSVLYGANAFSGVINLIPQKTVEGASLRVDGGGNGSRDISLLHGGSVDGIDWRLALRKRDGEGDGGAGRPDPLGYFHANQAPNRLTEQFDGQGRYFTDLPNPEAGEPLPEGFETHHDDLALRLTLNYQKWELGGYYWDKRQGLGSYVSGFEYRLNGDRAGEVRHRGYHLYAQHLAPLDEGLELHSSLTHRRYRQLEGTGFVYSYRFPEYYKSYHSDSSQISLEERLDYKADERNRWIGGLRVQRSWKDDQHIDLVHLDPTSELPKLTCWTARQQGQGSRCQQQRREVDELAGYLLWDGSLGEQFSHSLGLRHDRSDEFDPVWTPRLSLIYDSGHDWSLKTLYGEAFRQPSIFELNDEFRGNPELLPERIRTWELVLDWRPDQRLNLVANLFHSRMGDLIALVDAPTSEGGERYANLTRDTSLAGASLRLDYHPHPGITLFGNYSYTDLSEVDWGAPHKANLGINWHSADEGLNINLRANLVGSRKTPQSNALFHGRDAPGYAKLDLAIGWRSPIPGLELRLLVDNLLDKEYYGVGRQSGSNDIAAWDADLNPNPEGFIPPYHPQPGREIYLGLSYQF
jgi:outer membrane receptor protein involved in Fe transport